MTDETTPDEHDEMIEGMQFGTSLHEHFESIPTIHDPEAIRPSDEIMDRVQKIVQQDGIAAGPGQNNEAMSTPRPFEGVAIEQFDRSDPELEIEVTLTKENSFILIQPMVTDNGGVRFHVLTDAAIPDLLDVLGKAHSIVTEGWAQQQQQIAIRDGNAESYFRTRSASCVHTPDGEGAEIDSCYLCWTEAGSPFLPPIDGDHNPQYAPEVEGGTVIEGGFIQAPEVPENGEATESEDDDNGIF